MSNPSSERIDEVVCLYKFTGVFHDYIYFRVKNTTSNETDIAVIRTPWIINYEQKLIKTLEDINENFVNKKELSISIAKWNSKLESEHKCNWIHKANYKEWGVHKGSVFVLSPANSLLSKYCVAFALSSLDENYPLLEIISIIFGCALAIALYVLVRSVNDINRRHRYNVYTNA
jgi:hypothetical protein